MSTTVDALKYLKSDALLKDNFIDYSNTSAFDKATDKAASWRWDKSQRLETDKAFIDHQFSDFLLRYGFKNVDAFKKFLTGVRTIAEIGAGEGRLVDWFLQHSHKDTLIYAVEISDSVYYLKEKYRNEPRVTVIKADALNHPFIESSIDFLSCEQSIHHAPDPSAVFDSLCKALNKNSKVIISVFAKKSPVREKFDTIIRDTISKLSNEKKYEISEKFTDIGKILSEIDVKLKVPAAAFEFGNLAGREMTIQRFFYYAIFKCFYNKDFTYEKSVEFTYDWYSYPVCNKTSLDELCNWFMKNEIAILHSDSNDSNVNLRGIMLSNLT